MNTIPIERIAAMVCLTLVATLAMFRLPDPANVVINVIVGICGFVSGQALAGKKQ